MQTDSKHSVETILQKQESEEDELVGKRLLEKRSKTYHLTTNEQRRQLLEAISVRGLSVLRAANELNIKYSTAKTIWRIYSSSGRIEKKRQRRGLSEVALQNQILREFLAGRGGPLAILPLETLLAGKFIGPDFWAEQLTKHFNNE